MTPCYPNISHVDGTHPPRHYSVVFHRDHSGQEVARFTDADNHRADAQSFVAAGWTYVTHGLPDLDQVVEMAVRSSFNGSLFRMFGGRVHVGEVEEGGGTWLWYRACHYDLTELDEADDDYDVVAWRIPTELPPLPAASIPA